MRKSIKMAAISAAAALLVSTLTFAETTSTQPSSSQNQTKDATTTTQSQTMPTGSPNGMNAPNSTVGTGTTSTGATGVTTTTGGTSTTKVVTTPGSVQKDGVKTSSSNKTVTIVVEKNKKFRVCYRPVPRHVEGSRVVQRCGPYGCREFRIVREFDVTKYSDCHITKYACDPGYKNFGVFTNRSDARDAMYRCSHTISGAPGDFRVSY